MHFVQWGIFGPPCIYGVAQKLDTLFVGLPFDSIEQDVIWATFRSFGVDEKLTRMLKYWYDQSKSAVQIGSDIGEWFRTVVGTRQGDPISPTTFIEYLERVITALE